MVKFKRWLWPALCLSLVIGWAWTATLNVGLRDQVASLKQVVQVQDRWCEGLGKVNTLCEETMVDLAMRLGLDQDFMPLVTTALWRRSMDHVPVAKARRLLAAPSVSSGVLDDPKAALGGPDTEEPLVTPRTRR